MERFFIKRIDFIKMLSFTCVGQVICIFFSVIWYCTDWFTGDKHVFADFPVEFAHPNE